MTSGSVGQLEVGQLDVAVAVEAEDEEAGLPGTPSARGSGWWPARPGPGRPRRRRSSRRWRSCRPSGARARPRRGRRTPPTERTMAPRLRGSVIAVERDDQRVLPRSPAASSRSLGCAYSYAGTCSARPWCTRAVGQPVELAARRSRAARCPRSAAILSASRTRSSRSMPLGDVHVVTGTPARSASTTELRPATISLAPCRRRSEPPRRRGRAPPARPPALGALRRWPCGALWLGRGPRPSASAPCPRGRVGPGRRSRPVGPLLRRGLADRAACAGELPGHQASVRLTSRRRVGRATSARPSAVSSTSMPAAVELVADARRRRRSPCRAGGRRAPRAAPATSASSGAERVVGRAAAPRPVRRRAG